MMHSSLDSDRRPTSPSRSAPGTPRRRRLLAFGATLAIAGSMSGQNFLQINEIDFDNQVIEVANFDTASIDLSAWSIYQATETAGRAMGYWWGFPAGTTLPAGAFMRVRWLHPVELGNVNPLLLDTGETSNHFLFFLRGEPLDRAGGALGLVATNNASQVNTATFYRDFVAWGTSNGLFPREDLAVQNGRWFFSARTLTALSTQSLAFDSRRLIEPTTVNQWFRDLTPTLGQANHGRQNATTYGDGCVIGLGAQSQLTFDSIPVDGNADFRLVVDNLGAGTALAIFFGAPVPAGIPWVSPCRIYFDVAGFFSITTGASGSLFAFRPPLEAVPTGALGLQVAALRPNGSLVLTNGGLVSLTN